jgi:polysaccharide export outer membrane protein
MRLQISTLFWIILISGCFLGSCDYSKKVPYFRDITDTIRTSATIPELGYTEPVIQPNDILQVTVQTIDSKTGEIFAQSGKTSAEGSTMGYQVDKMGEIELPILNRVHVSGLTLFQARELIREKAKQYYVDPAVNVRFLSNYVILLGEVGHPGKFVMPNEKVSIMDAIGMAGDLPMTARRDNVLLIREENGQKLFITLDLNSSRIFQSPYYYLRSGDILYVRPFRSRARQATADVTGDRYIAYTTSFIYIFLTIYTLTRLK